jgi:16S rRNA (cytosine1402-N4)-methyltransferase
VLVEEVVGLLVTDADGVYVDGTIGGGAGHTRAILRLLGPRGRVVGLDRDPIAIREAATTLGTQGERVVLRNVRASQMHTVLAEEGIGQVDGVLLDLGISSDQLASRRGFSFERDGPLDLRFDPREESPSAHERLHELDVHELAAVFVRYGEFTRREARRYASGLLAAREDRDLTRVEEVRAVLEPLLPPRRRARSLARLFQALRILTNDELHEVEGALEAAALGLRTGGVLCVISYHSLEDRLVKRFMTPVAPPRRDLPPPPGWQEARFEILTRRPVRPGARETATNPRARSAKLRAARRR